MTLPRVAITQGDPAGIGPELIVRLWEDSAIHRIATLMVTGHEEVLRSAASRFAPNLAIETIPHPDAARPTPALLPCLSVGDLPCQTAPHSPEAGRQAYRAITLATDFALCGEIQGIVTCPISKAALHAAGYTVPGHTELLAQRCGVEHTAMMLYLPPPHVPGPLGLGVVHVTLHTALRHAISELNTDAIVRHGRLLHQIMSGMTKQYDVDREVRLGVCALNPHAGENELFGAEEAQIIAPAVKLLRTTGCNVRGPLPADTLLARAVRGDYDGVVAMYHDQGHIAVKLVDMFSAVNITLGLPIVRTSVAHGTAYDIAGQGIADIRGLRGAIHTCTALIHARAAQ